MSLAQYGQSINLWYFPDNIEIASFKVCPEINQPNQSLTR